MEKKEILCKRMDFKGLSAFWKEVNQAYADGWKYNEDCMSVREAPRFHGIIRVTLIKGKAEEVTIEDVIPDVVEDIVIEESLDEEVEGTGVEDEPVIEEAASEQAEEGEFLDSLTKKKSLLKYAASEGVNVPEDIKQPAAIKKHIKEQLSN